MSEPPALIIGIGASAAVFGKRREEGVDGPAPLAGRRRGDQPEDTILDGQGGIGWYDEDAVLLDRHATSLAATTGTGLCAPSSSTSRLL